MRAVEISHGNLENYMLMSDHVYMYCTHDKAFHGTLNNSLQFVNNSIH